LTSSQGEARIQKEWSWAVFGFLLVVVRGSDLTVVVVVIDNKPDSADAFPRKANPAIRLADLQDATKMDMFVAVPLLEGQFDEIFEFLPPRFDIPSVLLANFNRKILEFEGPYGCAVTVAKEEPAGRTRPRRVHCDVQPVVRHDSLRFVVA
jgi:hypothetical protein